jgi:hypothetical protein
MDVWMEMACPECDEPRPADEAEFQKLDAKYPLVCANGHKFTRADGLIHWLVELSQFGGALLSANALLEGEIIYEPDRGEYDVKLGHALHGARVWVKATDEWRRARSDVEFGFVTGRWLYITLRVPKRTPAAGTRAARYQVVGARGRSQVPGWRQVMGEALTAYEEGRYNVAVLLGNIAFETFYSSIADRKLRRKGVPPDIINELHQRIPLEHRLRQGFAKPLKLPELSSAPFWKDWQRKAREPRHGLAHQWLFDRKRKKTLATAREAYECLALQLKAVYYLDPAAFEWLARLRKREAAPLGTA